MKRDDLLRLRESWIVCFFLGIIMLNFPFLEIVNKDIHLFGFPLLVLYFLIGWPLSIFVVYLFSRSLEPTGENGDESGEQGGDEANRPT